MYEPVEFDQFDRVGIYILSYFVDGEVFEGIHTVAVKYDGTDYTTYNFENDVTNQHPSDYIQLYFCGYYIG